MDLKAMALGGIGGAVFGFAISRFLTREGCGTPVCHINGNPRLATVYYAVIGAGLGLTLHVF